MNRLFLSMIFVPFWASPNNSIYDLILRSNVWSGDRRGRALDPGFPTDVPTEEPVKSPPIRPIRPIPTDVPVPDPRDVPVREPEDVPPPEPGVIPKPAKDRPHRDDPKPRPTP